MDSTTPKNGYASEGSLHAKRRLCNAGTGAVYVLATLSVRRLMSRLSAYTPSNNAGRNRGGWFLLAGHKNRSRLRQGFQLATDIVDR